MSLFLQLNAGTFHGNCHFWIESILQVLVWKLLESDARYAYSGLKQIFIKTPSPEEKNVTNLANIYLVKFNNRSTWKSCEIWFKISNRDTWATSLTSFWCLSLKTDHVYSTLKRRGNGTRSVFVGFLLTLNIFYFFFFFYCWRWTGKCLQGFAENNWFKEFACPAVENIIENLPIFPLPFFNATYMQNIIL